MQFNHLKSRFRNTFTFFLYIVIIKLILWKINTRYNVITHVIEKMYGFWIVDSLILKVMKIISLLLL